MLKENIRAKEYQLGGIERERLIKNNKRIEINEILRKNERQRLKLKIKV